MRRQLPVYSPLSSRAIRRAFISGLAPGLNGQDDFRRSLERDYAADRAVLLASGTQALQVALQVALQEVDDARVALPAFTCFDVASAAVGAHARISCYDIDPETLGPDLDSLRRVLEQGVRLVVISPLYGLPVDWDAVSALLADYQAFPIEDAAQGHGAEWRGRPLGSLGPLSVLSFGRGKGWTGGSGGALLMRDQVSWGGWGGDQVRAPRRAELRVVASLTAQWTLGRPGWYALPQALPWLRIGETIYRAPVALRPMTRAASACLAQLRMTARREGASRRRTAKRILARIEANPLVRPIAPLRGATAGYLRLPVRLDQGLRGFRNPGLMTRLGMATSYPSPLAAIPQIEGSLDQSDQHFPGAESLVKTLFTLPTHSLVTAAEHKQIVAELLAYGEGGGQ